MRENNSISKVEFDLAAPFEIAAVSVQVESVQT
jgi:hypothetical protein